MTDSRKSKVQPPFVHSDSAQEPVAADRPSSDAWTKQLGVFDWKSAASLRAPKNPGVKAERAWDSTEWADPAPPVSDAARHVADQIDTVAQRIRRGALSVDGKAPTPETAMAAALEAIIRSR